MVEKPKASHKQPQGLTSEKSESPYHTPGSNPLEDLERFLVDLFSRRWPRPFGRGWPSGFQFRTPPEVQSPKVDIIEREQEIMVRAELPGVSKEEIDIAITGDNAVTIRAIGGGEEMQEKGYYHRREISRAEFQRTLTLPVEVKADQAKASFKNGILELTMPKLERAKRKTIKIE